MSPTKEQIDQFLAKQRKLPKHIAIIMDGNGRWAQQKGLPRERGHEAGAETLDKIVTISAKLGLEYLTLYAFSTENWGRPQTEVDALMHLLVETIKCQLPNMMSNNIRLLAIGDIDRLPKESKESLLAAIEETSHNNGLNLTLALSYSSRWEITKAVKEIVKEVRKGNISEEMITEEIISNHLCTTNTPDPDLLIRTGGEQRISNYLLWQVAYAELYFTPTYWPDFDEQALMLAIDDYSNRERRYGLTGEQITTGIH